MLGSGSSRGQRFRLSPGQRVWQENELLTSDLFLLALQIGPIAQANYQSRRQNPMELRLPPVFFLRLDSFEFLTGRELLCAGRNFGGGGQTVISWFGKLTLAAAKPQSATI